MDIDDAIAIEAMHMAVGIANVAVAATVGMFNAFDDPLAREGFEVLVDRGVTHRVAALGEAIINFAGRQMLLVVPQQLQNKSPLAADAHSQQLAAIEGIF